MTLYCIFLVEFYFGTADKLRTTVKQSFSSTANERLRNWCLSQ